MNTEIIKKYPKLINKENFRDFVEICKKENIVIDESFSHAFPEMAIVLDLDYDGLETTIIYLNDVDFSFYLKNDETKYDGKELDRFFKNIFDIRRIEITENKNHRIAKVNNVYWSVNTMDSFYGIDFELHNINGWAYKSSHGEEQFYIKNQRVSKDRFLKLSRKYKLEKIKDQ